MAISQKSRERWLEKRRTGIGGSDAPAIVGVSDYSSPWQVWCEKSGLLTRPPIEAKRQRFGRKMERVICESLAEDTGRKVTMWRQDRIIRSADHNFMFCTPDAFELDPEHPEKGPGIVQCKSAHQFMAHQWEGNKPPLTVQVQIQHEMEVTGCTWGTICVLIGNNDFRYHDIDYNAEFVKTLVEAERRFWQMVQDGVKPEIDGSEVTKGMLFRLHPKDNGNVVTLPLEAEYLTAEYEAASAMEADAKKRKEKIGNQIREMIGDNTFGVLPNGGQWSWKYEEVEAHWSEKVEKRVLRSPTKPRKKKGAPE